MKLPSKLRWLNWLAGRMKRPEWIFLGLMCLVTLGAWAFIEIAGEVIEGDADRFDRRILLAFRVDGDPTDPIGPAWVEEAGRDLTALGSLAGLVVVVTSVCGYLWFKGDHSAILYIIFAVVGAQALSSGLKVAFDRPRPDVVPHGDYVYTQSFSQRAQPGLDRHVSHARRDARQERTKAAAARVLHPDGHAAGRADRH